MASRPQTSLAPGATVEDRPAREHAADGAPPQNVAPQPQDGEVRLRARRRRLVVGLHVEGADAPGPGLPGEPAAADDRHGARSAQPDAPAVEDCRRVAAAGPAAGPAAEGEDALPFEKEFPLFRERQAEPRQVHLRLVRLDLREIGVVGEVRVRLFVTPYFTSMPASPVDVVLGRRARSADRS